MEARKRPRALGQFNCSENMMSDEVLQVHVDCFSSEAVCTADERRDWLVQDDRGL